MTVHAGQPAPGGRPCEIRLLHVADCPLIERVRILLDACLRDSEVVAAVEQIEGPYASPTLLIDGVDVATGVTPTPGLPSCRLDLPTREKIVTALHRRTPG